MLVVGLLGGGGQEGIERVIPRMRRGSDIVGSPTVVIAGVLRDTTLELWPFQDGDKSEKKSETYEFIQSGTVLVRAGSVAEGV